MQTKATPEAVASAIQTLLAEGKDVTGDNVHAITGGSRSTVLKEIGKWREAQKATAAAEPAEKKPATNVQTTKPLSRLSAAIEALQSAALDDLNEALQASEDKAAATIRAANDAADARVRDAESKAEQRVQDALRERDQAVAEAGRMADAADSMEEQRDDALRRVAELEAAAEVLQQASNAMAEEVEALKTERDEAKAAADEADRKFWKEVVAQSDLRRRVEVAETLRDAYKGQAEQVVAILRSMAESHQIALPPLPQAPAEPTMAPAAEQADDDGEPAPRRGGVGGKREPLSEEKRQQIIAMRRDHPQMSGREIGRRCGVSNATVVAVLKQADGTDGEPASLDDLHTDLDRIANDVGGEE